MQIHVMADDPFCEMGIVTELIEEAGKHAAAELIVYPGSAHLFADPSLAEYEPEAAEQLMTRTLEFLGTRS